RGCGGAASRGKRQGAVERASRKSGDVRAALRNPRRFDNKRTSGYSCGSKHSTTGNLAKPPPPRAPWLYSKRKWSPPAKSGARSGAHSWPRAQALISKFHTFPAEQDSALFE